MSKCPNCSFTGNRLATHWETNGNCSAPDISDEQEQLLTGILMGDASIDTTSTNPRMSCSNISRQYLEYIDSKFPYIGLGVKLENTSEECAKRDRESEFNVGANTDNYSDMYRWRTRCHPVLKQFADWYSSGEKVYPRDIDLTPVVLKHWFACDGSYGKDSKNNSIEFGVCNEVDNKDKLNSYFKDKGFDAPNWNISKRRDGSINASIYFDSQTTDELFDYMGEPLPGFEYKWK